MNYQWSSLILRLSLILVLVVILAGTTACQTFKLVIENQTDQVLTIRGGGPSLGYIGPGESITMEAPINAGDYIVFAQNTQGELVFAQNFTFETLQEMEGGVWKAVIPPETPHQGTTIINLIIENKTDMALTIFVDDEELGEINPGEVATKSDIPFDPNQLRYYIIAKNTQGQNIFAELLYLFRLQILDLSNYKLVIEPFYRECIFENRTDIAVTVFVNYYLVGDIEPGETMQKAVPLYDHSAVIEAKDTQGEVVYSDTRDAANYKLEGIVWTVVIPSPE